MQSDDDKTVAVLRERAICLAARADDRRPDKGAAHLCFCFREEKWAVELSLVTAVLPLREITPIPGVPRFIRGIANLRGQIVSVIDVRRLFEFPESDIAPESIKAVVIEKDELRFAIVVDDVAGVSNIGADDLFRSTSTVTGIREQYLKGITPDGVAVMDGERLLADPSIIIYQED